MSSEKFIAGRGIVPVAKARVRVPGWILAFNVPGLPYSEPSFTSIARRKDLISKPLASTGTEKGNLNSTPDVLGIAYLVTQEQYNHVLASEGGGIMYANIELDAVPVSWKDSKVTGPTPKVQTLVVVPMMERKPWPLPSERYMGIICSGAQENEIPDSYQEILDLQAVYSPPSSRRGKIGAKIFLAIWGPIMGLMEKITNATMSEDGCSPTWVLCPLFGGGDGLSRDHGVIELPSERQINIGKESLLPKDKGECRYYVV